MPNSRKSCSDMMHKVERSTSALLKTGTYFVSPSSSNRSSILPSKGQPPPPLPPPTPATPPPPLPPPTPKLPTLPGLRLCWGNPWASPPPNSPDPQLLARLWWGNGKGRGREVNTVNELMNDLINSSKQNQPTNELISPSIGQSFNLFQSGNQSIKAFLNCPKTELERNIARPKDCC